MKKHTKLSIAVCALLAPGMVMAGATTWNNVGGDFSWTNPLNWDIGSVPALDDTHINNGDAVQVNAGDAAFSTRLVLDNGSSINVANTASLDVYGQSLWGNGAGSIATGNINGAFTVTAEQGLGMAAGAVTTLNVDSGAVVDVQGAWLIGGYGAGATGNINVNGGSLNVVSHLYAGLEGTGNLTVNSGTVNIGGNLIMAAGGAATGTFTANGGVTTINGMNMGAGAGTSMVSAFNGGEVINVGGFANGPNATYYVGGGKLTFVGTPYDDVHALVSGADWTYADQMMVVDNGDGSISVTSIPEPATMGLMALFGGAMFAARRMFA